MRNSSAMAESPELICISSSDEEETDDEAKVNSMTHTNKIQQPLGSLQIYKLGSSVKSLSQRVSNLMGVTVVKKECCSTGVQTELSGDVVSAKPEQEDLVTESQPAAITRSTKSEGGSTPSVIEVDDIHDEDLVIKRAVVNDNSDCEAKLADFQSSVARMIHEMFPQIPILEGPENFEQLKANVEKIHNANMQLMERRMVVKRK